MHDLPAVTLRSDGHVLSAANIEAAGYRVPRLYLAGGELHVDRLQVDACADGHSDPSASEPNCAVWTDRVDRRLAALEARELTVGDLLATVGGAPDDAEAVLSAARGTDGKAQN